MTRFARAKGSKASNEKAPEDSTPWEVMKEQFLQAKKESEEGSKRMEAEKQRIENYENFLKEQKVQKRKATWCDFPEVGLINQHKLTKVKNPKKKSDIIESIVTNDKNDNDILQETAGTASSQKNVQKKKRNKSNKQNKTEKNISKDAAKKDNEDITLTSSNIIIIKKNKQKIKKQQPEGVQIEGNEALTQNTQQGSNNKKNKKNKRKQTSVPIQSDTQNILNDLKQDTKKSKKVKKNKKLIEGKPVRRKEINDHSFELIINPKPVELVRFDGFPVMKRDAERLAELRDSMIKKGIPKSEVQRTMKLERRRAEKALARLKRDVCYNCRKGGHNLSDCPELKSKIPGAEAPDGVCFKCGSTEHRQFECKVQRDKEFRFATCFICREPGHIARQCPDNPKGLYPNGGSCKLCGDVTHLRKDCPSAKEEKEETSIKLKTLDSTENIEGIDYNKVSEPKETPKKIKKIKF